MLGSVLWMSVPSRLRLMLRRSAPNDSVGLDVVLSKGLAEKGRDCGAPTAPVSAVVVGSWLWLDMGVDVA